MCIYIYKRSCTVYNCVYIINSYRGLVHPHIEHETAAAETSRAARQEKTFETGAQGQNPMA